jgi:hypothetical protein
MSDSNQEDAADKKRRLPNQKEELFRWNILWEPNPAAIMKMESETCKLALLIHHESLLQCQKYMGGRR